MSLLLNLFSPQSGGPVPAPEYYIQEDSTDRYLTEDGSGFYIQED